MRGSPHRLPLSCHAASSAKSKFLSFLFRALLASSLVDKIIQRSRVVLYPIASNIFTLGAKRHLNSPLPYLSQPIPGVRHHRHHRHQASGIRHQSVHPHMVASVTSHHSPGVSIITISPSARPAK